MSKIYILKCQNDKFYIGKTSRSVEERIQEHGISGFTGSAFTGSAGSVSGLAGSVSGLTGSAWTRLHKPIHLIDSFEEKSLFDEDNTTKKYMMKYGIQNVRGGSYATIELTKNQILFLKREFRGIRGKCYSCGGNHYISDCKKVKNKSNLNSIFFPFFFFFLFFLSFLLVPCLREGNKFFFGV